jgi:hypothetical protein
MELIENCCEELFKKFVIDSRKKGTDKDVNEKATGQQESAKEIRN